VRGPEGGPVPPLTSGASNFRTGASVANYTRRGSTDPATEQEGEGNGRCPAGSWLPHKHRPTETRTRTSCAVAWRARQRQRRAVPRYRCDARRRRRSGRWPTNTAGHRGTERGRQGMGSSGRERRATPANQPTRSTGRSTETARRRGEKAFTATPRAEPANRAEQRLRAVTALRNQQTRCHTQARFLKL
jgi:hypothetical protein